jgi:hypothetical protein
VKRDTRASPRTAKTLREPSKQENSRDLEVRRFAPVFYVMAKAMTRKESRRGKGSRVGFAVRL